jgi:glutamate:Na+ symporter, ESS family
MNHMQIFWSLVLIGILLLISKIIKSQITILEKLYLPSSIIAGFLALLLGPQVLGRFLEQHPSGIFSDSMIQVWKGLPGVLISVVFAALFLGKKLPRPRQIWQKAGPQVALGQTMAWGQYVVGISLTLLVLTPVFGINPLAGALIEIGFEGGHGTAAGMAQTFKSLGFAEGADLALGLATIGLVSGVVLGTILINWGVRRKLITLAPFKEPATPDDVPTMEELHELRIGREQETKPTDPLSVHLGVVGLAVGLGWGLKQVLLAIEAHTWGGPDGVQLIAHVPLFPLAMIGGVLLQLFIDKAGQGHHISRPLMNRISGTALDFTIVAALATLSLTAIGNHLIPFLSLATAGIVWTLFCFLILAPRIIPTHWFERGLGDFGQSTGVTVTGILLMRMADPQNKSGALESFGYKQLLFEPIVGGGLFTAAAMPLMVQFGSVAVLALTGTITLFWILFGFWLFKKSKLNSSQSNTVQG